MVRCPSCSVEIEDGSRFCARCGAAIVTSDTQRAAEAGATVTTPQGNAGSPEVRIFTDAQPPERYEPSSASSSDSIDQARFTPGTMLTERYRIVGLLGKGGMGEVYRADDLKLRQPVALKFLPAALSRDQHKLERFHHEVRVARQVSHPNVCRVYDIGEAQGQPFISMEYIDGEDLAKVIRRMGKPSHDKAIQIARQLCAGLAAAHDKGVLHRDLKPHNVMIDGNGKVRITDFGLAGFVEEFSGHDVAAGTPAYMAPEQIAGREVSVKSDLYSLGVVLFELFTGRRLFEGNTREQVQRARLETSATALSSSGEILDPAIERVISRCLESEPAARPTSAMAVAVALPGGDPLAAALEAGETPDPEMVAAAGDVGGLRPAIAIPCFLAVVVGLVAAVWLNNSVMAFRHTTLPESPDALAFRAREVLKSLGHSTAPADEAHGFGYDNQVLKYIEGNDASPERWERLAKNRPAAVYYWYRQSPQALIPPFSTRAVKRTQPPKFSPGMAEVVLDPHGRLLELTVVPPRRADEKSIRSNGNASIDWAALFTEAGLEFTEFEETNPLLNPRVYCEVRKAWVGAFPEWPDAPVQVEAGSYGGRPIFFRIDGPWSQSENSSPTSRDGGRSAGDYAFVTVILFVLFGSAFFAVHNLKLRRGDRSGAFRTSFTFFLLSLVAWVLGTKHVSHPWIELLRFRFGAGSGLFSAVAMWSMYIGFEPFVRRRWPQVLISWTRLLMGRVRDPLVGRDILIGAIFGVTQALVWRISFLAPTWFGAAPPRPINTDLTVLIGGTHLASALIDPWFAFLSFWYLFLLFALRVFLGKPWLAIPTYVLLLTTILTLSITSRIDSANFVAVAGCYFVIVSLHVVVLLRFGLVAFVLAMFFWLRLMDLPIAMDFSAWYATGSIVTMLTFVAVAAYGFHTALAGRSLFKDELAEA